MSCLAYWGVIDYMEVLVLSRDFAGFEFAFGTSSRNGGWERASDHEIMEKNIGFANVVEGWS